MESPNDKPIEPLEVIEPVAAEPIAEDPVTVADIVEVDDINPHPVSSGIEVAPTDVSAELEDEFNPMLFVQLGDRVYIESTEYGKTIGNVYYRSLEQIHIKPDGVSNILHIFEIEQTDDEEIYNEQHGVSVIYIIEKRKYGALVELENFKIGQTIDTYARDDNKEVIQYVISKIDEQNDSITIYNEDDPENKREILFDFIGIPLEIEFNIINIRFHTKDKESNPNIYEQVIEPEEKEEPNENEEEGFEIIGYIEVKEARVFKELPLYQQSIPDSIQKIDALNNFINELNSNLQKDPNVLRNIRILVETFFYLKQSIIKHNEDGSNELKEVSANTLRELIKTTNVPLGRPILAIKKKLYVEEEVEDEEEDEDDYVYYKDFSEDIKDHDTNVSKYLENMKSTLSAIMPWKAPDDTETSEDSWTTYADSDIYRQVPPHIHKNDDFGRIPGYLKAPSTKNNPMPIPQLGKISFGVERSLARTYRKANKADNEGLVEKIKKTTFIEPDHANLNGYLLFPQSVSPYIGTTRSNQLAVDSGRSGMKPMLLTDILKKINDPVLGEESSPNALLYFNTDAIDDYTVAQYIEGSTLRALAMGDIFITLDQYGMENIEINESIFEVIQTKLEEYQHRLIGHLKGMRATLAVEQKQEVVPFLEKVSFMEIIEKDPILSRAIEEYRDYNLSFINSDVGLVNYLMKKYDVYFQIVIGQNPVLYTKANLDINNLNYLEQLRIETLLKEKYTTRGLRPMRNKCSHVGHFLTVRKIYNNEERFREMINVFKVYQGRRFNNWIKCNSCNENLMCLHERLQLQAYINPAEKELLDKEIILKFAGGQFQGSYICRNCGQQIKSIDFDNSMEYDDNGKPMSGRAVLVDEDALFEERLDLLIAPSPEKQNEEMPLSEDEKIILDITKELTDKIGVKFEVPAYRRVITNTCEVLYNPLITFTAKKYEDHAKKAQAKKATNSYPPYSRYIAQHKICITAIFILIEIQCKVPSYNVRFVLPDWKSPGFNGYPLVEDDTNRQGLEYLAYAIASIKLESPPWILTKFITSAKNLQSVLDKIKTIFNFILKHILRNDMIQYQLAEKRKYIESKHLTDTDKNVVLHLREDIPVTFLPQQILITKAEAAESQITEEIVKHMGEKGEISLVRLWIRHAHKLAKDTAITVRGSPLLETTCCVSPASNPHIYWKENHMPELRTRTSTPNVQAPFIMPSFIPRKSELGVVEPNKEEYYAVFLKYCFIGPRTGYPHEPGLTYHCLWCGFQFPTNPNFMVANTEGKAALQDAKIDTDEESFNNLLDKIHTVNSVQPVTVKSISSFKQIMDKLASIRPAPIAQQPFHNKNNSTEEALAVAEAIVAEEDLWESTITTMTEELIKHSAMEDIYIVCADISELIQRRAAVLQQFIDPPHLEIINSILRLPWRNLFQVIQTYFIVPLQRLYSKFNSDSFVVPKEYDLSDKHIDDVTDILKRETNAYVNFKSKINTEFVTSQSSTDKNKGIKDKIMQNIKYLIDQFVAIMPFKQILSRDYIPGNEVTLGYIKNILFMGPLYVFIQSFDTKDEVKTVYLHKYSRFHKFIFKYILEKYDKEKLSYDDDKIKLLIAIRDEKERVGIVKNMNALTDEERSIELMNKRLGLGKWAVGGTKLIYAYDKDYYDLERQKRMDAGIIDFPGSSDGDLNMPEGRKHDEMGAAIYTDAELEAEGGYDNNQHADDDNE